MKHRTPHAGSTAGDGAPQDSSHSRDASLDKHFDELEWQAQERALRGDRDTGAATDDVLTMHYRRIDAALRHPPLTPLPMDFAASVARQARNARSASDERFERILTQLLIAVMGISAGVICVLYGARWWSALAGAVPGGSGSWLPLIALCVGSHWILERWRERHTSR